MSTIARPQANPRKTTSVRHLGRVDIDALLAAVQAIPEATWDAENADKPNKFEALAARAHRRAAFDAAYHFCCNAQG